MSDNTVATVNIRPGVSMLAVLQHLHYEIWYALAEFIDNSLQSYLSHRAEIEAVEGDGFRLKVSIEIDPKDGGRIVIRDNAAGIHAADYPRAFRPAEIPPDRSGLSEFGMGMKSAACWLAKRWTVRTSALGEPVTRSVHFNIDQIVLDRIEELSVEPVAAAARAHFTEITLEGLQQRIPQTKTIAKVKQHLRSIYRVFLRKRLLIIEVDGEALVVPEVKVLRAPFYKEPAGPLVTWRRELNFDFGLGLRAYGFAALREKASTSDAGFALFRRDRLIQGSADEGYRPEAIFGRSNSYRYQRLFGELHLEGFNVTHTKDGFQWDEQQDAFLECLKEKLEGPPYDFLEQAEEHRVRPKPADIKPAAEQAAKRTAEVIEREVPPILEQQLQEGPEEKEPPTDLPDAAEPAARREISVVVRGSDWTIDIELSTDPAVGDWLTVSEEVPVRPGARRHLGLRVALAHPFMERFGGSDPETLEPLVRVAAGLALAETTARAAGVKMAGTIRRNLNEFLRDALSKP